MSVGFLQAFNEQVRKLSAYSPYCTMEGGDILATITSSTHRCVRRIPGIQFAEIRDVDGTARQIAVLMCRDMNQVLKGEQK